MSRSQRLAFLAVAAVIAVVAVVVLAGGGDDGEAGTAATTPIVTQPAEAIVLEPGSEQTIEAKQGDRVRFTVRSDVADEVHVHGYDITKDIEAGGEAELAFTADITGIFEIELEAAGEPLGRLRVEP